jgi:SAM-dependent methyltransferase
LPAARRRRRSAHLRPTTRRVLKAVHRTLGPLLPPRLLAFSYPGIPGRVHVDDQMLESEAPEHVAHYLSDALSAIENIEASLAAAGRSWHEIASCLDLPSGYGRVTRHLVRRIDRSRVTACDIDPQAVRFCAAEFGVEALRSRSDLRQVSFPRSYDLIFVGSLLTHLTPDEGLRMLEALVPLLNPEGQLIFTTQGASCLEHLSWYGEHFAAAEASFRQQIGESGTAYVPYPGQPAYGITLHASDKLAGDITARLGDRVSLLRFAERGWDRHQDVWTYQLRAGAAQARTR